MTATRTATLPTAASKAGRIVVVEDGAGAAASFPIVVACNGSETINGAATVSVGRNRGRLALYSDGTNWKVLWADVNLDSALRFVGTADKTVTNTTSDTSLFPATFMGNGLTFPANYWAVGRALRTKGMGAYTTPLASQVTIKVKLGGVTLCQVTTDAFANTMTDAGWNSELLVVCRSTGATGVFNANGQLLYDIAGSVPANSNMHSNQTTPPTVDTTVATTLDVTAAWDTANVNRSATVMQCSVEVLA